MSGPIPAHIADAAGRHAAEAAHLAALLAEASARRVTLGRCISIRQREQAAERAGRKETPGGAEWRGYSVAERVLLVMHAAKDYAGDPRQAALQPWGSFSDSDRAQMGAMARQLARAFKNAAYLI